MRRHLLTAAAWLVLTSAIVAADPPIVAFAADLPTAPPSDVGVGRLDRIKAFFKAASPIGRSRRYRSTPAMLLIRWSQNNWAAERMIEP